MSWDGDEGFALRVRVEETKEFEEGFFPEEYLEDEDEILNAVFLQWLLEGFLQQMRSRRCILTDLDDLEGFGGDDQDEEHRGHLGEQDHWMTISEQQDEFAGY